MSGLRAVAERLSHGPASIAYLGNSVTAQKDGYRPHLHAALCLKFGHDHRAINAGFGGVGAIGSVCTMDDWVIRHRPELCFIECMTGDFGVGLHADTGAALEGMLRKLARIGSAACFLNLSRRDADFSTENPIVQTYRAVVEHHGITAIDLGVRLAGAGPRFFRDEVHNTPEGARHAAELIFELLEPILARDSAPPRPAAPLHARDFSGATVIAARPEMVSGAGSETGRFRLQYPYLALAPGSAIRFASPDQALLGLLLVLGPHSGAALIGGTRHELRDQWCHFERLHAYVLGTEFPPGTSVEIAPLPDDSGPTRLKLAGFLTRPV
jgi:hypothetical protein